jgi:hypothetical protein
MIVDKSFALNAMLCHNYLPTQRKNREEIPPIFSTEKLTPEIAQELVKLPARKVPEYSGYDQMEYKLTRFNSVSRLLSIPHPLAHAKLCFAIHDNWEKFDYVLSNSCSQIKPHKHPDGRLIVMSGYSDCVRKEIKQLDSAFGMKYRVSTDIANCFPSIYSHAVPWALVGFLGAKEKKGPKHSGEWFNKIDKYLRSCKRDETQGIAIGPAVSNVISEIILARIDQSLTANKFQFSRYIDDYICHCESEHRAEEFVRVVEQEAAKFKLQLNVKKTSIDPLPLPVTDRWVVELGNNVPIGEELSAFDAFRYLDFAVSVSKSYPEGSVLKYAAGTLVKRKFKFGHEVEVLNYLLTLAFHHPDLLPVLTKILDASYLAFAGAKFDLYGASKKLERIVCENARLSRSDGMCWALYYLGRVEAEISKETAELVIKTADAFAILTLYWTKQHESLVIGFVESLVKTDLYLLDRYWILLYELFVDGKYADPYNDQVFTVLRDNNVNFLVEKQTIDEDGDDGLEHAELEITDSLPSADNISKETISNELKI